MVVASTTLENHAVTYVGGAIQAGSCQTLELRSLAAVGNSATFFGGGLWCASPRAWLSPVSRRLLKSVAF